MQVSYLAMAPYAGPAPGFEVWPAPSSYCDPGVAHTSFEQTLSLSETAEELGFDWISVAEHHYAPYMMTPNPAILAGALVARIKKAKIALLGPLVPIHNPVRLAEEIAMLDAMSGGRIRVMPLRGTPNEHHTYDTPPEKTRAMTQEGIDLMIKAWTEDQPFAWKGEHYSFSTVSIWPRPLQKPHPILFGSGNSEESIRFAAERRMGIGFSFAPPELVQKWIELYRRESAKLGWTPTPGHVLYRGITYVAPTDEMAQSETVAHFRAKTDEQSKLASTTLGGPPLNSLIIAQPYFVGGPETLLKKFEVLRDCGVGIVDMAVSIGSHEQQLRSLQILAEKVLPTVQSWDDTRFTAPLGRTA